MELTLENLEGVQKECYDLLKDNQKAIDDNTEWCIAFWWIHVESRYEEFWADDLTDAIRKYPPESLTKYRRNLITAGLIKPSESSKKHSTEMEAKNHKTESQWKYENELAQKEKQLGFNIE